MNKKNISFGLIAAIMIFALAGIASAAASLSVPGEIYLGATADQERNTTTTAQSFTIKNDGNVTLNGLVLTSGLDQKYGMNFSLDNGATYQASPITLATMDINGTITIYYKGFIPSSESTGPRTVGVITIANPAVVSRTLNVQTNVKSKLTVGSITFSYGDEEDTNVFDFDGTRLLKVRFTLKNDFPKGDDIDFDSADIKLVIEDLLADSEDYEKTFTKTVYSGTTSSEIIKEVTLPASVDSKTYRVRIEASGYDSRGAYHKATRTTNLEFKKKSRYVAIQSASISPSILKCTNDATVTVSVANLGTEHEYRAVVSVNNPNLGIASNQSVELTSSDDSVSKSKRTLTFPINLPSNIAAGRYTIGVDSYSGDGKLWDSHSSADLTVQACDGSSSTTTAPPTTTNPTTPVITTNTTTIQYITNPNTNAGQLIAQSVQEPSFMESTGFIVLLALAVLIVFIVIIVLLVKLIK